VYFRYFFFHLVMGNHGRALDHVFNKAQERLRDVFGMEMVELTSRGRGGQSTEKGTITPSELSYRIHGSLKIQEHVLTLSLFSSAHST